MEYNPRLSGFISCIRITLNSFGNLHHYLTKAKIEFVEHSKYPVGDERRAAWSHWYPIGLLNGKVEIHFLHYYSGEGGVREVVPTCGKG